MTGKAAERKGKCYELAWQFIKREQEGSLVHGRVFSGVPPRWINHAWVELPTGYVYEPVSGRFVGRDIFYQSFKAEKFNEYDWEKAAILAVRSGNYGPWERVGERELSLEDYDKLYTLNDLRKMCRERGIYPSGDKKELVSKLLSQEVWDLDEIKSKIQALPPDERREILKKYPDLALE